MLTHPPTTDQTPVRSRRKPSTGAEAPLAPAATTQPEAVLTRRQARTRAYASEETRQDPAGRAHTPTGPPLDAFEAAARLFSFAPQQAAQSGSASALSFASNTDRALSPAHPQPHSRARALFLSVNFLGLVALLTIGMTVDAEALPHEHAEPATAPVDSSRSEDIQAYVTPGQTQAAPVITRDGYSTATLVDLAGTAGIMNYSSAVFTNNPDCAIQWPYAVGVPMTYGFGMRDGKMHEGTDFVPASGLTSKPSPRESSPPLPTTAEPTESPSLSITASMDSSSRPATPIWNTTPDKSRLATPSTSVNTLAAPETPAAPLEPTCTSKCFSMEPPPPIHSPGWRTTPPAEHVGTHR